MSDVPISRLELQCLICGRGPLSRGTLRRHQLTTHRGDVRPPPRSPARTLQSRHQPTGVDATPPVLALCTEAAAGITGVDRDAPSDATLHAHDAEIAALLAASAEVLPPVAGQRRRPRDLGPEPEQGEVTYPSLATRVQAVYEGYGDTDDSVPLARRRKHSKAGQFNTRRLRLFESFVLKVAGCGLPGTHVDDLWDLFFEWESDGSLKRDSRRGYATTFPTPMPSARPLRTTLTRLLIRTGGPDVRSRRSTRPERLTTGQLFLSSSTLWGELPRCATGPEKGNIKCYPNAVRRHLTVMLFDYARRRYHGSTDQRPSYWPSMHTATAASLQSLEVRFLSLAHHLLRGLCACVGWIASAASWMSAEVDWSLARTSLCLF